MGPPARAGVGVATSRRNGDYRAFRDVEHAARLRRVRNRRSAFADFYAENRGLSEFDRFRVKR